MNSNNDIRGSVKRDRNKTFPQVVFCGFKATDYEFKQRSILCWTMCEVWLQCKFFLLKYQDKAAVEEMIEEQVELLRGNRKLYDMIDNNMMNGDLDPFFIKEHC